MKWQKETDIPYSARCNGIFFVFACYAQGQEFYPTCEHTVAAHVNDHISI